MRGNSEMARISPPGLADRKLESAALEPSLFRQAEKAFLEEDYQTSLDLVRNCLDQVPGRHLEPMVLVPDPDSAQVKDAVVLWARNLYQLDRFAEFEVLMASAGRWGLIPDQLPELDVVQLGFCFKRGQYAEVVAETTRFIQQQRRDLPPVIADYLYLRGLTRSVLGDPGPARDDAETAYSLFKVLGKDFECARTANLMGILFFRGADYPAAEKWFRKAFDLHKRLGMRKNMGGNLLNIGIACYRRGALGQALLEFDAARALLDQVGARVSLCRLDIARGNTLRLLRDFADAQTILLQAFERANTLNLAREEALALEFLGDVARDQNQIDKARRYYSRALAVGRSIAPDGDIVMEVLRRQGQCLTSLGRESEAVTQLSRALTMARSQGDSCEEGICRRAMAEALFALGDLESARRHGEQAVALLDRVGAGLEGGKARLTVVRIELARLDSAMGVDRAGTLEICWRQILTALDSFLRLGVEHWTVQAKRLITVVSDLRAEHDRLTAAGGEPATREPRSRQDAATIVHVSTRMRDLIQLTDAFADSGEPVLVTGATGTGKELFARRLHEKSGRRNSELVSVNVTAIPESVFAREFFGHVKGSFSGADRDGPGLAARADGGTLFLDEIGEMPLELQPRLLRLLQDGTYHALGDPAERRTDIRLVAATNADLEQLVAQGKFRADLYYRLKILELKIPPVKDRREDVLPLLRYFLSQDAGRQVNPAEYFNSRSLELMERYDWPGNVREIAMVASQARVQLAGCGNVSIEVGRLDTESLLLTGPEMPAGPGGDEPVPTPEYRRSQILLALAEADGNRAQAARNLGVSRSTLYRRMDKLGIL
jgi:DNA-binding NtrC family response regulator/tetratricopeptide (TPR) repeat protein